MLLLATGVAVSAGALATGAVPSPVGIAQAHPEPGDVDGDLVPNEADNCPTVPNGAQVNTDGDPLGDSCDPDDDDDGVADTSDNCRIVVNPDQADANGDGRGDACPPVDTDGDGYLDEDDNCLTVPNPDQIDLDGDDKGDLCDRDDDNDLYDDGFDNCPVIYNPDQADLDGDRIGSACDPEERIAGPAGTPAGGDATSPGGGATPGSGPAAGAPGDRTAPRITLALTTPLRLSETGRSLILRASCSEACDLAVVVDAGAAAARRARLGRSRVVLARGSWSLAGPGHTYVFAGWTRAARRLGSGRRLTGTVRLTATDAAGNKRTVTRRLELRG
ncbi:MAG TPA: thrombospondin type 3 repeat-containing protein [Solirubrobacteraceae bacterium]|nr:thrombospondin type 3 repeat-containing protein [Solirubrobacteraceae bacterium]